MKRRPTVYYFVCNGKSVQTSYSYAPTDGNRGRQLGRGEAKGRKTTSHGSIPMTVSVIGDEDTVSPLNACMNTGLETATKPVFGAPSAAFAGGSSALLCADASIQWSTGGLYRRLRVPPQNGLAQPRCRTRGPSPAWPRPAKPACRTYQPRRPESLRSTDFQL